LGNGENYIMLFENGEIGREIDTQNILIQKPYEKMTFARQRHRYEGMRIKLK
jgi:hypothetical protein